MRTLARPDMRSNLAQPVDAAEFLGRLAPPLPTSLPRLRSRLVGHRTLIAQLAERALGGHVLLILGPGGIGKTTAAIELARTIGTRFQDGVAFVDLAPIVDAALVPAAVAAALGMPAEHDLKAADMAVVLAPRHLVLVLDNCEHVIEVAASLCEEIQARAPRCCVIATSREALRCPGEIVYRVPGLAVPAKNESLSVAEAMAYSAIELFVDRAGAHAGGYTLRPADVPLVAALCRRLDGVPLAIELAAALADRFTLEALAELLDTPHALQISGMPATSRHASLGRMLAWSYELLDPQERWVFERLAIFSGRFSVASACVVAGSGDVPAEQVPHLVARLAAKSLVVAHAEAEGTVCRLLEITRSFALDRLAASGQHNEVARRHALALQDLLRAAGDSPSNARTEWVVRYGALVDDVRAALGWAFSPQGDGDLALALVIAATPMSFQLSLWTEFFNLYQRAIDRLETLRDVDPAIELQLRMSYGEFLGQRHGPVEGMSESYEAALRLAQQQGNAVLAAKVRDRACMGQFMSGRYAQALELAWQCAQDARTVPEATTITRTDRMLSQILHCLGRHDEASELAQRLTNMPAPARRRPDESAIDPAISARVVLARIAWLRGRPDHARTLIDEALQLSEHDVPGSLAHLVTWGALPLAVWRGEPAEAIRQLRALRARCTAFQIPYWATWIPGFSAQLGFALTGEEAIAMHDPKHLDMLATFGGPLHSPSTLERAQKGVAPWCAPEVLRVHAESLLRESPPDVVEAERLLRRSLVLAGNQGALGWELRSATSLARLWARKGLATEAHALLSDTYGRFSEGFDTGDLVNARRLLAQLRR